MIIVRIFLILFGFVSVCHCQSGLEGVRPVVVTEPVTKDSDDPAIWLNPNDVNKSLILGTDKAGVLFAFNLEGKEVARREGMGRLNNVDVEYGVTLGKRSVDVAVATDRNAGKVYLFELPHLTALDGGNGIPVFVGEDDPRPMGVGIFKRPSDGATFVILSRKSGPVDGSLWQYRLVDAGALFKLEKVRAFGAWSGGGEIEAIAVDDAMGVVYYSDEWFGVRKYWADPDREGANTALDHFGLEGFADDREGISIYERGDDKGYILVSDQQADVFRVFTRENGNAFVGVVKLSTKSSDGSDVTSVAIAPDYPKGLFVAMSDDRTFQLYDWRDIEKAIVRD